MLADAGFPQNPEFPALVNPYVSVRDRVDELERAQTGSKHGSDPGKRVQRFFDKRDWELQSARARVEELESLIKRQGSRTSFESVASMDPQTLPGLAAATLHPRPMSIADPLHEWYETDAHDPHARAHVYDAPPPPPPAPPHGGDDESSSSDESEVKIKKKKRSIYKVSNAEMRCLNTRMLSPSSRGGVSPGRPPSRRARNRNGHVRSSSPLSPRMRASIRFP